MSGISFQAVEPEEPKERDPKLAVQDRGTSSLFASAERNRGRPGTEVSNVQERDRKSGARPCRHLYVSRHNLNVTRCGKLTKWSVSCMAADTGARPGRPSTSRAAARKTGDVTFDQ